MTRFRALCRPLLWGVRRVLGAVGMAVATTLAGGMVYVLCALLSSLDDYLAGQAR